MTLALSTFPPHGQAAPTVYGVVLNDRVSLEKLGPALTQPPYKEAPRAPVLYIKPAPTHRDSGALVTLPAGADGVEVGATLGLVLGTTLTRGDAVTARAAVQGVRLAADLSLPHSSYYRPAIREKCFDGALPLGALRLGNELPDNLAWTTEVDGVAVGKWGLADLIRQPYQLLAEVSQFMSFYPGDMLLVGVVYQAPQARLGSRVRIQAHGVPDLPDLQFTLAKEVVA